MLEKLKEMISDYATEEIEEITTSTRFVEDLGFDSFSFVSLLGEMEEEFDIEVDESKIATIKTVGEAADYIESLRLKEALA